MKVPDGWTKNVIGEVVDFQGGTQPPKSTFVFDPKPGYVRMIQTRDFRTDRYITYIPERLAKNHCQVDDILIGRYGPPVFQIFFGLSGAYNVALIKAIPDEKKISKAFLYLVLNQDELFKLIDGLSRRSAGQAGVDMPALRSFPLPLPPLPEQFAITSLVNGWDRAIRQLTDLIAAKVRFKQGLMQQLLTGKRRFRQFIRSNSFESSPAGNIPVDWELHHLGKVTEEIRRKNDSGITRVLTASGNHGLVDQRDYFNRSVAGKSLAGYTLLQKGDFAYNRSLMKGYPFGATKRLGRYDEGIVSTLYLCFRITSEQCTSDWLAHAFESDIFNSQLRGIAKVGARAHGLLNVAASEFFQMTLPIPSLDEQRRITATLNAADEEIGLLKKQLITLKNQKKGLMQKLLTGQVRVKP